MPLPTYVQEARNKKVDEGHGAFVSEAADTYGVDSNLLMAMIDVESNNDPQAISPKGAGGLMQIMPNTAEELGIEDINDPRQNIMGGAKYISKLLKANNGDLPLALASYNAGPGNVRKHGGIPPFKETQDYVDKVTKGYNQYKEASSGLPDYVKKVTMENAESNKPEDPDYAWMKWHPYLAGLYGAGKGVLEQAIVPSIEATGAIGGTIIAPFAPIASTALGYGIAANLGRQLKEGYKRLGGEEVRNTTVQDEMIQSASDVGTALVLGKAMDTGAKIAPVVDNYLFHTLPKRLYGSAVKMPMSKKWIKTLPDEVISQQTIAIEEGLNSRVPPSEYGLAKIKGLKREVETYIDDITEILSQDPKNFVSREAALEKGLAKARAKADNSSDKEGAHQFIDAIAERFRAQPEYMTPQKANAVKRQLYDELSYKTEESTGLSAQMSSVGKKGVAHEIMLNLEDIYPPLAGLNATDAARISLHEAIEKSFARETQKNLVPLGAKIMMNPKTWPLALWEATIGHPQVKTRLAFALHKAEPTRYPAMPPEYVAPPAPEPAPKPAGPFKYQPPAQPFVKGAKPNVSLPEVESPGAVYGPRVGGFTPDQLSKMLKSDNPTQQSMAIDDIIDVRKRVEISENERRSTINKMLESFKNQAGNQRGSVTFEFKDRRLQKALKKDPVVQGEPHSINTEGKIIDKYGRQLETASMENERLNKVKEAMNKYDDSIASEDILDPFTYDLVHKKGDKISGEQVQKLISDIGYHPDNLSRFLRVKGKPNLVTHAGSKKNLIKPDVEKKSSVNQLNMMIPLDEVPPMVRSWVKKIKDVSGKPIIASEYTPFFTDEGVDAVKTSKLYRNKELFDETGFWLGKDGKWRYEVSDYIGSDDVKFNPEVFKNSKSVELPEIYENEKLYKALPELKNTEVVLDENLSALGNFNPNTNRISIKKANNRSTLMHEIQHAANSMIRGAFGGSSKEAEMAKGAGKEAYSKYRKNPGEIEARLTQERIRMTPEQRKKVPPWATLDTMLMSEGNIPLLKGSKGSPIAKEAYDFSLSNEVY